jgi:hypothetical protein
MDPLAENARLFTSDATAMYTNIKPAVGIATVKAWFSEFESELPKVVRTRIVIAAIMLVMTRNKFQFDDMFWQQFIVTAMGSPCACVYATVAYEYHERTKVISRQQTSSA